MTEELFRRDAYAQQCQAKVVRVAALGVELDRTVFYPTGGGQPGDSGVLRRDDGQEIVISGCVKDPESGVPLHQLAEGAPPLSPGETVSVTIDWPRRHRHMRMHTCMHVLLSLVEGQVTGGAVGDGKGRVDFNLPESPDKQDLEARLNQLIAADLPVTASWIDDAELDANPDLIRTMSVQPPRGSGRVRMIAVGDVDYQPCGGTHVKSTAEIGPVRVGKIENKGKQNRRINLLLET